MAIDTLQLKLKKCGSALVLDLTVPPEAIPGCLMEEFGDVCEAYNAFCRRLMSGLKGELAAVRFRLLHFALLGEKGSSMLTGLLKYASSLGYYTFLDIPGLLSGEEGAFAAKMLWGENPIYPCDAAVISAYPGSDVIRAFQPYFEEQKKDLFVIVRSPNRSAGEIQDLLAGIRTVHVAAAEQVNRFSSTTVGKNGYARIGIMASATTGDSIRTLRGKYPALFMLIDGLDCPGGNAKNCSYGFDKLGHGVAVGIGSSVTLAWQKGEDTAFVEAAVDAVRKANKRIANYITIL